MRTSLACCSIALLVVGLAPPAAGQVVITEVSADPVFVELTNAGTAPVALKGYRLTGDVTHVIYRDETLAPGASRILTTDRDAYLTHFGPLKVAMPYPVELRSRVAQGGGELRLYDPRLRQVDLVRYGAAKPGRTWQRRSATTAYRGPANWERGAPTPERFSERPLPAVLLDAPRREPRQPRAKQPLIVSVRVHGAPQTVVAVWETRGGSGRVVLKPRPDDPTRYAGVLPPQPALTLLRYRFEAAGGATLRRAWRGEPFAALIGAPPAPGLPPLYHLELAPEDLRQLKNPGRARLPATFSHYQDGEAVTIRGVTLQIRGGNWTRTWRKKGWTLRFPRTHPLRGRRRTVLRASWRDLTYLRELLGYRLFAAAGVPAPRARGLRLYVNGAFHGLYVEVEDVDEAFLLEHGLGGATLYKAEEPYAQEAARAGDWADGRRLPGLASYRTRYALRAGDGDHTDLQAFVDGYLDCPDAGLAAWFAEHLRVERYVQYLAVCALLTHWDSVVKNYLWARDRAGDGRWSVLPWDLDLTFGDYQNRLVHDAPILLGTRSEPVAHRVKPWHRMRDRFLQVPAHRRRLFQAVLKLTETAFRPEALDPVIDAWIAQHEPWIAEDREKWELFARDREVRPVSRGLLRREVAALKHYVAQRRAFVRAECARLLAQLPASAAASPSGGVAEPGQVAATLDAKRRARAKGELFVLLLAAVGLVLYLRSGGLEAEPA